MDNRYDISQAHRDFLSVCFCEGTLQFDRIFTTNFDNLLDKAFGTRGIRITKENTRDIGRAQRECKVPILYLHGRLETKNYQITEADIFDEGFKALHTTFRTALDEATAFVFVGYSMNDPDFRRLYLQYRADLITRRDNDKDTYVVAPVDGKHEYALGKAVWKSRRAVWIPVGAGVFFERLKEILSEGVDAEKQERIMYKYGLKDDEAFAEKVARTAKVLNIDGADAIQFLFDTRTKTGATV